MKKSLKTTVLAIALMASITGAFASKAAHTPNRLLTTYNWTGTAPGSSSITADIPTAQSFYGCEGLGDVCANGQNVDNPLETAQIRFED